MSADTTSSLYPQRPIRPLPKRRLRERLAPGVAESIQYPPTPQNTTPLFQYPYPLRDDDAFAGSFAQDRTTHAERRSSRRNGVIQGSEGGNAANRQVASGSSRAALDSAGRRVPEWLLEGKDANSQHHPSAASSVDGYDLLENTNNKKKRKIPAAAEAALSAAHEALESASAFNSNTVPDPAGEGHNDALSSMANSHYAPSSFSPGGQNIPGPGRGRYGRPRSLRVPLTPMSESTTNLMGRGNKLRSAYWLPGSNENTGIISSAIANAEKLAPPKGPDSQSLLQQAIIGKRSPATTQFTFTCDSQVPGMLAWPGSTSERKAGLSASNRTPPRATNESWSRNHQVPQFGHSSPAGSHVAEMSAQDTLSSSSVMAPNQQPVESKRSVRQMNKLYSEAARARQRKTREANKRQPPEKVYVCDFCYYEAIFGRPPLNLIRQYEIKERKSKQEEEERRAKLERLRLKGKQKPRKNPKVPKTAGQDAHPPLEADETDVPRDYDQRINKGEAFDNDEEYEEYDDRDDDPDDLPPHVGSAEPPDVDPPFSGGVSSRNNQGGT